MIVPRRFLTYAIVLLTAMVFLGFSALATIVFPFPNSKGFPFTYSGSVDACRNPYTADAGFRITPFWSA